MKKKFLVALGCTFAMFNVSAQVASDNASNASYADGWVAGDNGGTGFSPWLFDMNQGSGSAGVFIGSPASADITGMSPTSFGFFANPPGSGANAGVSRSLLAPLQVGEIFSFQWGLNWDSDSATSNRGVNLRNGATEILNINMGNSSAITINGNPMFSQFGTQAFVLNFEQLTPTSLRVFGTGRNGVESYNNVFSVTGSVTGFSFYFNATEASVDQRQMYVNNFEVVPEPQTLGLLVIGAVGLFAIRLRRRMR
jgi:hypothetical protein